MVYNNYMEKPGCVQLAEMQMFSTYMLDLDVILLELDFAIADLRGYVTGSRYPKAAGETNQKLNINIPPKKRPLGSDWFDDYIWGYNDCIDDIKRMNGM